MKELQDLPSAGHAEIPTESVPVVINSTVPKISITESFPVLIDDSGPAAKFAWEEFIYGKIRNPHTRSAYEYAIRKFLKHCDQLGRELLNVSPRDIGVYLDGLDYAPATKKLHLSALRHFFDTLVIRHVVVLNPAASVRGERLQVIEGKTPEISIEHARKLKRSFDISSVIGLRDRAVIMIMAYTAARVSAIAKFRRLVIRPMSLAVIAFSVSFFVRLIVVRNSGVDLWAFSRLPATRYS